MNTDQEFEALRRALKLKRYENPPPRYFNEFSSEVIARIRAEGPQARSQSLEQLEWEAPWLQRLLNIFQTRPFAASGLGAALCVLAVGSAVMLKQVEPQDPFRNTGVVVDSGNTPAPAFVGVNAATPGQPVTALRPGAPTNSIFDMFQPDVRNVNWEPGNR